jgi:hypothetical protein
VVGVSGRQNVCSKKGAVRWPQLSRGKRPSGISRRQRPQQKENAQSLICQNLYAPPWVSKPRLWRRTKGRTKESNVAESDHDACSEASVIRELAIEISAQLGHLRFNHQAAFVFMRLF